MAQTSVELKGKRTKLFEELQKMNSDIPSNEWNDDVRSKWDAKKAEHSRLKDVIALTEEAEGEERTQIELDANKSKSTETREQRTDAAGDAMTWSEAYNTYLRYGKRMLKPEERSMLVADKAMSKAEERAQSVGTDGAGGYLVNKEYDNNLVETMKQFGGMWQVSNIVNSTTGGQLLVPGLDETTKKAAIIAEAATLSATDMAFTQIALNAYKYGSALLLSEEFVQDEGTNILGEITRIMGDRFGRGTNEHFTTGDGSGKPTGVTVGASDSSITMVADTITRQKLLNLLHAVDPAYRDGGRFMFNDDTLLQIMALDHGASDSRPVWAASMRDGTPATIIGKPYTVNQDMPLVDTSTNRGILFGDFSRYTIRQVRSMAVRRTDDRHIETDQIGFYAFARFDGKIVDSAAIKYMAVA